MTRTFSRLAASTAVAAGLVLSAGATAHAEGTHVKDKASDVGLVPDIRSDAYDVLGYQASIDSGIDLRGMRVNHGSTTVTLRLKFAQLGPETNVSMQFRSNGRREVTHYLLSVSKRRAIVLDPEASDTCSVPLKTRTGRKGILRATIKRSCLGNPDRIKVQGGVFSGDLASEQGALHVDPISNTQVRAPSWTRWLTSG
ncbi:hypothetical protein [Aeromicrobium fastidiosum]|uniref:Uncharacterized protein n=1 Tax=Aeromicrobium fastidiosum TaxID=52699 RepID=A0A641AR32_9ACTN|nr:hypothetical protein [Aeromicrobium fastidiosum]KAA1378705.1 hypothetical protein ESP62_010240 [Aeromicrobium fastidiosum]MBP2392307.1 hypothetical protein [Aeromicrobium fastidiosum]